MTKEQFQLIDSIYKSQPWINKKYDELSCLLFDDCDSDEKRQLVFELIKRFTYITTESYSTLLNDLALDITTDPHLMETNTQVVAMAADSSPDSSQEIIYRLKTMLSNLGWTEHLSVNTFGKSYKVFKEKKEHTNIVLVDEFIGSGKTAKNRVDFLKKTYSDNGHIINVDIRVIAASTQGIQNLQKEGINVKTFKEIKRGIADYYPCSQVELKAKLMKELEGVLSDKYKKDELPHHGYGAVESLYARDEGNIPNNVFPIFWWPEYKNKERRKGIFNRAFV